jgi:hypothetical protein
MTESNATEMQEKIRRVLKRAAVDAEFRALAVRDGHAAFRSLGLILPADITIRFVDNHESKSKIIALPDPVIESSQLSEDELEEVSGGCLLTCVQDSVVQG